MPRNAFFDLAALVGSPALRRMHLSPKRTDHPGDQDRDVFGPHAFIHCVVDDAPGNSDFGRSHRSCYEYSRDLPPGLARRDGGPLHSWPDVPVHHSPPMGNDPLRNVFVDVEDMLGLPLLGAVAVPVSVPGPPPGWGDGPDVIEIPWVPPAEPPPRPQDPLTGEYLVPEDEWPPDGWDEPPPGWVGTMTAPHAEPGATPPTWHQDQSRFFVHCLVADSDSDDIGQPQNHVWEFFGGMPPPLRRRGGGQDNGPLHVFLGVAAHQTQPPPQGGGPPQ